MKSSTGGETVPGNLRLYIRLRENTCHTFCPHQASSDWEGREESTTGLGRQSRSGTVLLYTIGDLFSGSDMILMCFTSGLAEQLMVKDLACDGVWEEHVSSAVEAANTATGRAFW